jgi:hypothetical protein
MFIALITLSRQQNTDAANYATLKLHLVAAVSAAASCLVLIDMMSL